MTFIYVREVDVRESVTRRGITLPNQQGFLYDVYISIMLSGRRTCTSLSQILDHTTRDAVSAILVVCFFGKLYGRYIPEAVSYVTESYLKALMR